MWYFSVENFYILKKWNDDRIVSFNLVKFAKDFEEVRNKVILLINEKKKVFYLWINVII